MKKMGLGVACLAFALSGGRVAQAAQSQYQGYVTDINAIGSVIVFTLANGTGQLSCPGSPPTAFWVDPSTPIGQSQLALAITAKMSGVLFYVQVNGTCSTAWPSANMEQLAAFDLKG